MGSISGCRNTKTPRSRARINSDFKDPKDQSTNIDDLKAQQRQMGDGHFENRLWKLSFWFIALNIESINTLEYQYIKTSSEISNRFISQANNEIGMQKPRNHKNQKRAIKPAIEPAIEPAIQSHQHQDILERAAQRNGAQEY